MEDPDDQACPACGRRLATRVCGVCGVRQPDSWDVTLDPLMREMWLVHARNQQAIRKAVTLIAWAVITFAVLTLLGGWLWYGAVERGTIGSGF